LNLSIWKGSFWRKNYGCWGINISGPVIIYPKQLLFSNFGFNIPKKYALTNFLTGM